jgi:hypothetical protein
VQSDEQVPREEVMQDEVAVQRETRVEELD